MLKILIQWSWIIFLLLVLFLILRLYFPTVLPGNEHELPTTVFAQLESNRNAIDDGGPTEMQKLFPEGYYFCYALQGLTWINVALRDSSYSEQAIEQAETCFNELDSDRGKAAFPKRLPPECGMFYSAWKAHLLSGIVLLEKGQNTERLNEFRRECDKIANAIGKSPTPFLPSYENQAWPCDTVPAIHALYIYDHVSGQGRYRDLVSDWLENAKQLLDSKTGLFPHMTRADDGRLVEGARATSQVVILRFLADIEPNFGKQQYERYRELFYAPLLGLPAIREYPSYANGWGDVDSGPLIFGRSLSATVFGIGTAQVFGDQNQADAIAKCGETVGLPWTWNGNKSYLGKVLPIGDIMVAYNYSALPWLKKNEHCTTQPQLMPIWWRWPVHLASLVFILPMLVRRLLQKIKNDKQLSIDVVTTSEMEMEN